MSRIFLTEKQGHATPFRNATTPFSHRFFSPPRDLTPTFSKMKEMNQVTPFRGKVTRIKKKLNLTGPSCYGRRLSEEVCFTRKNMGEGGWQPFLNYITACFFRIVLFSQLKVLVILNFGDCMSCWDFVGGEDKVGGVMEIASRHLIRVGQGREARLSSRATRLCIIQVVNSIQ